MSKPGSHDHFNSLACLSDYITTVIICCGAGREYFSLSVRWYHENKDRDQAEEMLKKIPVDGAFLVRRSETDQFSYAISFR